MGKPSAACRQLAHLTEAAAPGEASKNRKATQSLGACNQTPRSASIVGITGTASADRRDAHIGHLLDLRQ
ncbi:hypothetical protein CWO91_09770 [Bradyrhizobium genosp. SA-3]|uniref:hypothetical protein n=1 Tax=Bradyrhizobium genosp. SA-3 TaxID=508868 RepID=UPI001028B63C|nr:hypothetical protein [Bradyrhizobium genosp. SA-3]RZN11227.1 hypothetical protein CWO91_09770 [Bradyrhizobium genosp. SA-3]